MNVSTIQVILGGNMLRTAWAHDTFAYWMFGVMVLLAVAEVVFKKGPSHA